MLLGKNNDLYSTGTIPEDQMKVIAVRHESDERYEANIYREAARRVVFQNCMTACEIEESAIPNFNRKFYFYQLKEQACLQDCFNTRMQLHFGRQASQQHLLLDF